MPWIRPRYLWEDKDRHGNTRRYVKQGERPKIRIRPDPIDDPEAFWTAYRMALDGRVYEPATDVAAPLEVSAPGTMRWLIERWKESPEFAQLDPTTRHNRSLILDSCCREPITPGSPILFGQSPIGKVTAAAIRMLRDRKRDLPHAANHRLKAMRRVFAWTLEQDDLCARWGVVGNPARDVSRFKTRNTEGIHTWSLDEVEQYEKRHPRGTMARLALALFMFTGQRLSDVVQFGRQHLRRKREDDGRVVTKLVFTQHKNRRRKPVTLELPILDVLQSAIDEGPSGQLTFLVTSTGRPFTSAGFGNKMREWCDQAGLRNCSSHGLRKIGACIVAENGATDAQMMAIFGWSDPAMAAKYRRMANQQKMARDSMHHLVPKRRSKPEPAVPLLEWGEKKWEDRDREPRAGDG